MILAEARLEPSRALSRAGSEEVSTHPDRLKNLGANIASDLDSESQHFAFFAALRRQDEKAPGSEYLGKIRDDYIGGLRRQMIAWPFESAVALIESDFTPAEKAAMLEQLSHRGDLDEPELWATWLLGIDSPADKENPVINLVISWSHNDPTAVEKWLKQVSPGDLKNQLIGEFAYQIANSDPARGMRAAGTMTEGPFRTKIIDQIGNNWKAEDPDAAAAFARDQ